MSLERTYPHGVTCWVDTGQPDPGAAARFYGELLGWTLTEVMPPGAPGSYLIATLDGQDVAAIGSGDGGSDAPRWNTYVAVDDADAGAAAVEAAGGSVLSGPQDAGPAGRLADVRDPAGVPFRLWQAGRRLGAQIANVPGAWNFSDLHTTDLDGARRFYGDVFGWVTAEIAPGRAMIQVPGYGDHLAATSDPGIRERQASAPAGFADVIGGLVATGPGEAARWEVTFSVADRDRSAELAERLGASVLSTSEDGWTRKAVVRDPQGAVLTLSQFTPRGL
jgi:uncharacterized protein